MLNGKNIVLGVTGSIAAYKIVTLVRLLKKENASVKIVMTESAKDFITPLTLSTLSGNPVLSRPFDPVDGSWNSHVDLGNWADVFLIAPASANTLAKMAAGIADNLLLTVYLASKCKVLFAPAMDLDMYKHPATQNSIKILKSFGNMLISPNEGELASGLCGAGRMEEPEIIIEILKQQLNNNTSLNGKKVLVTAGPTFEPIDPVRYIGNRSSGLMGFSIAEECANRGASVKLICGPVNIETKNSLIERIDVQTAEEMFDECSKVFESSDIMIMAAAVADFTPEEEFSKKIKKEGNSFNSLNLKPTKDILADLGKRKRRNQLLIGFALETENEIQNASKKLNNKNLDFIVLNSLKDEGAGFNSETNKISIIDKFGKTTEYNLKTKNEVAFDIIDKISQIIKKQ